MNELTFASVCMRVYEYSFAQWRGKECWLKIVWVTILTLQAIVQYALVGLGDEIHWVEWSGEDSSRTFVTERSSQALLILNFEKNLDCRNYEKISVFGSGYSFCFALLAYDSHVLKIGNLSLMYWQPYIDSDMTHDLWIVNHDRFVFRDSQRLNFEFEIVNLILKKISSAVSALRSRFFFENTRKWNSFE